MSGFMEGEDRHQATLLPESLDEYIAEDSAVRVIDVFIGALDISRKKGSNRNLSNCGSTP